MPGGTPIRMYYVYIHTYMHISIHICMYMNLYTIVHTTLKYENYLEKDL